MDWHVEMSFEGSESVFEDPAERDRFGDLIEVLPSVGVESPSLSFGSSGFGVSAAVSAATPLQALTIVEKGLQSAFQNAGLPMLPQVEARAVERSRFERDLDEPAGATN
jgi:hypothetical protein